METQKVLDGIQKGNQTVTDIADEIGEDEEQVNLVLETLASVGVVEKNPSKVEEGVPEVTYSARMSEMPSEIDVVEEVDGDVNFAERMPVNRDYDWDRRKPSGVPEYFESEDELTRVKAEIKHRHEPNTRNPKFWFTGPTGCGKTLAARKLADDLDAVFITIQCKYSMNESAIVGSPMLIGDDTIWSDGPAVKALLASKDHTVVLLLDEANRARPEAKEALYPVLDGRAEITIDQRGNEVITGDPENLIVIATTNEGPRHMTEKLDDAERRRYGNKYPFSYLGMGDEEDETENRDSEAELVTGKSAAPLGLSKELVDSVNEVRNTAAQQGTEVKVGVPTSKVIDWAQTAYTYYVEDIDSPLMKAARVSFINPFYDDDERAFDRVETIIRSAIEDAPLDEDEFQEWADRDMNEFVDQPE